jgi:hypothetical protein
MIRISHYVIGGLLLVIALMAAGLMLQLGQIKSLKLKLAEVKLMHAEEVAARERAARVYAETINQLQTNHATQQQERESEFIKTKARLEGERAADRARAVGLRQQLEAATSAGDRQGSDVDAATCQRDRDRLEALGRLAGEGLELLEEGRGLLSQREAELTHLLGQLQLDRQALLEATTSPTRSHAP